MTCEGSAFASSKNTRNVQPEKCFQNLLLKSKQLKFIEEGSLKSENAQFNHKPSGVMCYSNIFKIQSTLTVV